MGALWSGSSFPKDFHKKAISLYPQLLAFDCANLHSNKADGSVYKVNLYNAIPDRMQVNYGQRPMEKLDLFPIMFKLLGKFQNEQSFVQEVNALEAKVKRNFDNLFDRITKLEDSEISLRSEFRVELKRAVSMANLINHFMSDNFIQKNTVILKMSDFSKYLKHLVKYFKGPIMQSLEYLKGATTKSFRKNFDPLISPLITLSAFESMLCFTLFSGATNSYMNKMLWSNRSAEAFEPLRLLKSMLSKNRIMFTGSSWDDEMMLIRSSNQLLASIVEKYKIKEGASTFECHRLFIKVHNASTIQEKVDILWESYFNVLWKSAPEDFYQRQYSMEDLKMSHVRVSRNVIFPRDKLLTSTKAVDMIFNVEKLKYPAWRLPFLVVFNELTSKNQVLRKELIAGLIEFADRNIEYVHNCLATDRYFPNSTFRAYFKIQKPVEPSNPQNSETKIESDSPNLPTLEEHIKLREKRKERQTTCDSPSIMDPENIIESDYLVYVEKKRFAYRPTYNKVTGMFRFKKAELPKKRNRVEYTTQEKIDLFRGWNKLSKYEDVYSRIINCDSLCLGSGRSSGKPRTNKDLNDAMKRMILAEKVYTDDLGRRFILDEDIGMEDCIEDFEYNDPKKGKYEPHSTIRSCSRNPNSAKEKTFPEQSNESHFKSSFESPEEESNFVHLSASSTSINEDPGKSFKPSNERHAEFDTLTPLTVEKARAEYYKARRASQDKNHKIIEKPSSNEVEDQEELYSQRYNPERPSFIKEIKSDDDENSNDFESSCFVKNDYVESSQVEQRNVTRDVETKEVAQKYKVKSLAGLPAAKADEDSNQAIAFKKALSQTPKIKPKRLSIPKLSDNNPEKSVQIDNAVKLLKPAHKAPPTKEMDCDEFFGPINESKPLNIDCNINVGKIENSATNIEAKKGKQNNMSTDDPLFVKLKSIISNHYPGNEKTIINLLYKLPSRSTIMSDEADKKLTWSYLYYNSLSSSLRSKGISVWKKLYMQLIEEDMIELTGKTVTRLFENE